MTLRDEQVAFTRRTIINTVIELTGDPDAGPITIAKVSRRSGASPATIYRHFPNRDALVSAAAVERAMAWEPPEPDGPPEQIARDYLVSLWSEQAANLPLARQATVTDGGRELRLNRFHTFRPKEQAALREAGFDPDTPEARNLLACVAALTSVHAFLDLHDRQDLDVEAAVDAALWGCATLMEAVGVPFDAMVFTPESEPTTTSGTDA
jgi:AcrR family transcriptional regulator